MSLFYNNYQRLAQENVDNYQKISNKNRNSLLKMMTYLSSFSISKFDLEILRKDLIGMCQEADSASMSLDDYIGIPEKEFCDSLAQECQQSTILESITLTARTITASLLLLYTIEFMVVGFSNNWGISPSLIILAVIIPSVEYWGTKLMNRKSYLPQEKKKKFRLGFASIIFILYLCFCNLTNEPLLFYGHGRGVFAVLLGLTLIVFLGSNYYWDCKSNKYHWK